MTKPLSPQEVNKAIPDYVIAVVNELIEENYRPRGFTFTSAEVKRRVLLRMDEGVPFDQRWLDFEPVFRKNGWNVEYDKPGYNESYDGFYKFSESK
jgi:hypothetical protein